MATRAWAGAAATVLLAGLASSFALDRYAPFPSADIVRGSEDAFVRGLHPREFSGTPKRPERWTTGRVEIRFDDVPSGPRRLEVALYRQRQPVAVAVDGVVVGSLQPRVARAAFELADSGRDVLTVELRTETFLAGDGRRLGAYFDRVTLFHERRGLPSPGLVGGLLTAGLGVLAAAAVAGVAPVTAVLAALGVLAVHGWLLWPCGLVRSAYADVLPSLLVLGGFLAAAFARWRASRAGEAAAAWAFGAVLAAFLVQAVVLTSPMVVTSDAVFHANRLQQVAGGDFFPVSRTQHARPFRIPYPVSFYVLLAPLAKAGLDPVALVRYGAGLSAALGSAALFLIGERQPRRAALAVLLALSMPIAADVQSYGVLSNVFGQAVTLCCLAWWLAPRGGAAVGAALLLAAALSHLSCLIVLVVLLPLLLWLGRPLARLGRARLAAVAAAAVLAGLYYWQYLPVLLEQLPRLAEGSGTGQRALSLAEAVLRQASGTAGQWGVAATLLAALGLPWRAQGEAERLLVAAWLAGAVLAAVALVSPLEVRYAYALGFGAALAAARGLARLWSWGTPGRLAAAVALVVQLALAATGLEEIVLFRYRP